MTTTTLSLLAAAQRYGGRGYGGMMGGWGWGFAILAMLFWLAVIVLIVVVIWKLMERRGGEGHGHAAGPDSALDILQKRYARGEIDREEFERMKRDLM